MAMSVSTANRSFSQPELVAHRLLQVTGGLVLASFVKKIACLTWQPAVTEGVRTFFQVSRDRLTQMSGAPLIASGIGAALAVVLVHRFKAHPSPLAAHLPPVKGEMTRVIQAMAFIHQAADALIQGERLRGILDQQALESIARQIKQVGLLFDASLKNKELKVAIQALIEALKQEGSILQAILAADAVGTTSRLDPTHDISDFNRAFQQQTSLNKVDWDRFVDQAFNRDLNQSHGLEAHEAVCRLTCAIESLEFAMLALEKVINCSHAFTSWDKKNNRIFASVLARWQKVKEVRVGRYALCDGYLVETTLDSRPHSFGFNQPSIEKVRTHKSTVPSLSVNEATVFPDDLVSLKAPTIVTLSF